MGKRWEQIDRNVAEGSSAALWRPARSPKNKKLWKVLQKIESLAPNDHKVVLRYIDAVARDDARGSVFFEITNRDCRSNLASTRGSR